MHCYGDCYADLIVVKGWLLYYRDCYVLKANKAKKTSICNVLLYFASRGFARYSFGAHFERVDPI